MLKFEDRIIALRDAEIQELTAAFEALRSEAHAEILKSNQENRRLRRRLESYEWQDRNEQVLLNDLSEALEQIEYLSAKIARIESMEVQP